jgi:alanine or glycine:cation symporter, AGCS family
VNIIEKLIASGNTVLWGYVLIVVLLGLGIYFTIGSKFAQIRHVKEMFRLLKVKEKPPEHTEKKQISSLQAFFVGAGTRIGTGNLAGVAIALAIGGPGAVFWMWMVAILGSASSFVENTLAQIYKAKDNGRFKGGPAYYMKKQLNKKWMSALFAVMMILSYGTTFNAVQSNTIAVALENSFGISPVIAGIALVILTSLVVFGGIKRIADISSLIVPFMALGYILLAVFVVITNITEIPHVLVLIFKSAFGIEQVVGGGIAAAIMNGVKRGLFSNGAGIGGDPIAAATASVSHPAKQGFIQALGVFFDTLLVCSATAFIILTSDAYGSGLTGIELSQAAMAEHFGAWGGVFLGIAIFLFAFTSIIGCYYYGEANLSFISKSKGFLIFYRVIALGMVMFGAVASLQIVWDLADFTMAIMALINLVAIAILGPIAFKALDHYMKQRKLGKEPVFFRDDIKGLRGVEAWPLRKKKSIKQVI